MVNYKRLIDNTSLGNTPSVVFTNTATETNYFKVFILHNYSTASATFTLWDGANIDVNKFMSGTIDAGETITYELTGPGMTKSDVETIFASCSAATSVSIRAFGGNE